MADTIEPKNIENIEPGDSPSPPSSDRGDEVNLISLRGYFGLDAKDSYHDKSLQFIYNSLSESGVRDMSEMLLYIKDMERRLGPTPLGENRLVHVKNYLKVLMQIGNLEKIKETYER